MKQFWIGFATCYLMGAIVMGNSLAQNIPCVNLFGASVYGALWPLAPLSVSLKRDLYPITDSMFRSSCKRGS